MTPEARVAAINKAATLTDEQKTKIKAIYEADVEKMMGMRDSAEDRATMRTEANAEIKALLTDEQKPKFDKYLASRKFNFNQEFDQKVQELFQLEESELLLQGVDKIDRLKQYFDQITVLRGAAFNGFVLFSLALFGLLGKLKESWSRHRILQFLAFLPPVLAVIFVVQNIVRHDDHLLGLYSDPPLAELVILLLGGGRLLHDMETSERNTVPPNLHHSPGHDGGIFRRMVVDGGHVRSSGNSLTFRGELQRGTESARWTAAYHETRTFSRGTCIASST
jgi:hypothetical protein